MTRYVIKCNDCHKDIGVTDGVAGSAQGGFCQDCMSTNLEVAERVQQQLWRGIPYKQDPLFDEPPAATPRKGGPE